MVIPDKVKNIVLEVSGGIGRNISATAVVRAIKKAHPTKNIIVLAGAPEVFMYNPNVKRTFNFGNPLYFYEDFVNDENFIIKEEPYVHYDYLNKNKHLVECWCDILGVPCDGVSPDIYLIPSELASAEMHIKEVSKRNKDKPVMLFQWIGGKVPEKASDDMSTKQALAAMYKRSIPYDEACNIAKHLNKDYTVAVVGHTNFPDIPLTEKFFYPLRNTIALLKYCEGFVGIDSFLQHAAASIQIAKPGVVLWGGTSHKVLGYDIHSNIYNHGCPLNTPCHRPNSYLFDITPTGGIWECPYGESCMNGFDKIVIDKFQKK